MQTISEIRALLETRGLRPKRRFGQNFLHDKNQLTRLVDAAGVEPGAVVLEVGPGTGTLTEALMERDAIVIAAEIDRDLITLLEERFASRITLVAGDCLGRARELAPAIVDAIAGRPFTLIANLPYGIASPLMIALLYEPTCVRQVVTIQREVADRMVAVPSTKAYGPLTVITQTLANIERIAIVKPTCFWPVPKVTSAMITVTPKPMKLDVPRDFARFVVDLFGRRRKQLGTTFGRDHTWPEGVTSDLRPDALSPEEIVALWETVRG